MEAITKAKCFLGISDGSGEVWFYVSYTEQEPVTTTTPLTENLPLGWGSQLVRPVDPANWTLTATLFNGSVLQFNSTDNSHEYLQVLDEGSSIQISAPATDNLLP